MRRAMLLGVILALTLSGVVVARDHGQSPPAKVTGTYTYTIHDTNIHRLITVDKHHWSWARLDQQGNVVDGLSGDVTCMVSDGQDAWVAGPATAGTVEGWETYEVGGFLWVHDGDRPHGQGDLAISWMSDPGWTFRDMETFCANRATAFTPEATAALGVPYNEWMDGLVREPLTSGDLKVR